MVDRGQSMQQEIHFTDRSVTITTSNTKTLLPRSFTPGPWTVVCARGKEAFNNVGNRRLRVLVEANLPKYVASNKVQKSVIIAELVNVVRESAGVGAFVRLDPATCRYIDIDDASAREKVGQQLREGQMRKNPARLNARKQKRRANAQKKRMTSNKSSSSSVSATSTTETSTMGSSSCDSSVSDSITTVPTQKPAQADPLMDLCNSLPPLQLDSFPSLTFQQPLRATALTFPDIAF